MTAGGHYLCEAFQHSDPNSGPLKKFMQCNFLFHLEKCVSSRNLLPLNWNRRYELVGYSEMFHTIL